MIRSKAPESRLRRAHRWVRRIWITLGVAFLAGLAWNVQAHGVPAGLLESTANVTVTERTDGVTFEPAGIAARAPVVVFLPGALVAPRAYVPLARGLADSGVSVAIVELPWRIAPGASGRQELWRRIDAVRTAATARPIVLAGHSRGAALAAQFVAEHRDASGAAPVDGLVLVGTTHPRDDDLSWLAAPVLKIVASADCVASPAAARENEGRLPVHTRWLEIAGGNHRQFGYYGWQLGDCTAAISREVQHRQAVDAIVAFVAAEVAGH